MKFFDLFAGIGGFALALNRQGNVSVGHSEINNYADTIYRKHFNSQNYGDATKINWGTVPSFDILTAGFPCQAFSIAGKRKGFEDTRGTIFFEIARCLEHKKPKVFILENVKGLLNHEKGKTFQTILETLNNLGYNVEWQIINTKDYLPQSRERIFFIGHLRGTSSRQIFPFQKGGNGNDETQGKTRQEGERIRNSYCRAIGSGYAKSAGTHGSLIKVGHINKDQQGMRVYDTDGLSATLTGLGGGWGAKTGLYMTAHTKANMKQRYQERDETWTLDTNSAKMALSDRSGIRRLTPKECERLQGFPDDWTYGLSDTQRYKCLGNAVSVPVVEDILSRLFP